jgi:2-methylcitrate dehydratase PrpD
VKDGRTPVADALVDFVLRLQLQSLPDAVTRAASLCLTDWVGAALRGATEPLAGALDAVIAAAGGEGQATVVGRGRRTSALLATLANGAQGHALDFDDTHLGSIVHGSAPVAPVVLAVAEWRRRPGSEALEAFVAGFEVETRVGRVIGPLLADRGWHVTGLLGHFGAAAAAGKLLALTAPELTRALGIAGTQAAGLQQSLGTMCKPLHPGKAAMSGLLAALLAREGFTGPTGILDERPGLPGTFVGITDLAPALEDLGKRFEILDNSTKLYAACHLLHATIDAGRAIRARAAPSPEAIAAVECSVHPLAVKVAAIPEPRSGLEAKFSAAYCAALALTRGEAGESEFTDAMASDPGLLGLASRVRALADPALGIPEARMRVRLRDGRVLDEVVRAARGTPGHPVSREEVEEKFRRLAGVVLPAAQVGRLLETLRRLPDLPDVGALAALLAPPRPRTDRGRESAGPTARRRAR